MLVKVRWRENLKRKEDYFSFFELESQIRHRALQLNQKTRLLSELELDF